MGSVNTQITTDLINLNVISDLVPSQHHGATNIFIGIVRNKNLGRSVLAIEYDCFIPLCEKVFHEIANEAIRKWDTDANVLIIHRHGRINIGEISVAIIASTGHRDESYRITRYIIEEIKVRAPIWKKEFYTDGETDWVRGHALCQHNKSEFNENGAAKVKHHEHIGHHSCGR